MRVLVVEDDRALGTFLKSGLEMQGHRVDWVEDGEAALLLAAADHPDLVLLDLGLPKRMAWRFWRRCGRGITTHRCCADRAQRSPCAGRMP